MPALIRELAIAGSRKSDGTANASGKVFLYEPGTTTIVAGYTDDTLSEAWTTDGGGIPLDAGGRVAIWINEIVDIKVEDSDGGTVNTYIGYNKTRAEQVEVENDGFTGALTDSSGGVSQELGGKTDLDTILTRALGSLGTDFRYKESPGAESRDYIDVIGEIHLSVKSFGAVGNGVADDTVAIQKTIDRVKALGGGVVFFPPGTYKISAALALASGTGISFRGNGIDSTIIQLASTTANAFTLATCTNIVFEDFQVEPTAANTGAAFSLTSVTGAYFTRVQVDADGVVPFGFRYGVSATSCTALSAYDCQVEATQADASGRALLLTGSSRTLIVGGLWSGPSGAPVEFAGNTGRFTALAVNLGSPGPLFAASLANIEFTFIGCVMTAPTVSTATDMHIRIYASNLDGTTTNVASGGTFTPNRMSGPQQRCRVTSVGANITVAAPTPPPRTDAYDVYLELMFFNNGGADTTGWSMDAVYHLEGAAAPSVTNLEITTIRFKWDPNASVWREVCRAVTT